MKIKKKKKTSWLTGNHQMELKFFCYKLVLVAFVRIDLASC